MNWKTLSVGAAILALGFALRGNGAERVSPDKAHELVKAGATLLDVRTTEEFADGHIQGAVNIPVQDLSRRQSELGPKNRPVVVYCFSGGRSARAADELRQGGFTEVYDLGGMSRWNQK